MKLVIKHNGQPATTSEVIAANTENEHRAVLQLIRQYQPQIEEFGTFAFEMRKSGGRPTEYAIFNEQQATFILTLMRNSDTVVRFKVALVKAFYEMRSLQNKQPNATSNGLAEYRKAKAIQLAEETAAKLCARFSKIGEASQQVIFAKLINPIAGTEVLMLPKVEERLLLAKQVGEILGVSANMIGRIANRLGLKTAEHGEYRLDKSEYSAKEVEVFHYNAKAVEVLRAELEKETA